MSNDSIAKRRHLRLSAMGRVDAVVQGGEPQEAYLASISRGGLGLYLPSEVRPNQLVLVNLSLPGKEGDAEDLKVATRVRWCRGAGKLSMVGLAFEQMSDARYRRLLQHMNLIEGLQLRDPGADAPPARPRFTARE